MSPSSELGLDGSWYEIFSRNCESASHGAITQQSHLLDAPSRLFPTDLTGGNRSPNAQVQVTRSSLEGDEDTEDWTKYLQYPSSDECEITREDSMVPNIPDLGQSTTWKLSPSPHSSQVFKGHQFKKQWNENGSEDMHATSIITSKFAEQFSPGIQATQIQSRNTPFQEINSHSPSSNLRAKVSGDVNTRPSTYPLEYISHLGGIGPSAIALRPVPDEQSGVTFPVQSQPPRRKVNVIEKKQKVSSGMKHQESKERVPKDLNQNDKRLSHLSPLFPYNFERNKFEDLNGNDFNIQRFQDNSPDKRVSVLAKIFTKNLVFNLLNELRSKLQPRDFENAQKIWTVENLVPLVYFIVSQNPTLQVWKIVHDLIVFLLLHYHCKLLSSGTELDYVLLARFLLWQTDMFFHMMNPSIRSSLTIKEEEQQRVQYKMEPCKSTISRMFMSIYRPKYFASMKTKDKFLKSLLKQHIDVTWDHDMRQDYPSNGYDLDKRNKLWKDWKMTSSKIVSEGDLELDEKIQKMFLKKRNLSKHIFQQWNKAKSLTKGLGRFHEVKSINIHYIDGFCKYIHAFDYLITSYIQEGGSIRGLSKQDHYLTVLSKSLMKKNPQEEDSRFWTAFNNHRMFKSGQATASSIYRKKRKKTPLKLWMV